MATNIYAWLKTTKDHILQIDDYLGNIFLKVAHRKCGQNNKIVASSFCYFLISCTMHYEFSSYQ